MYLVILPTKLQLLKHVQTPVFFLFFFVVFFLVSFFGFFCKQMLLARCFFLTRIVGYVMGFYHLMRRQLCAANLVY